MFKEINWLNKKGASLAEILVTVLIMSLVTLAIAAGVTTASRVYRQISMKAEAQTLLGTSVSALNNDFAFADMSNQTENANYGEAITFFSNDRGYNVEIHNDPNKGIMVASDIPLVTSKTMTLGLYTKISNIQYDVEKHYFTYHIDVVSSDTLDHPLESETISVNNTNYGIRK